MGCWGLRWVKWVVEVCLGWVSLKGLGGMGGLTRGWVWSLVRKVC